jgi:hypothetical protein
MVSPEHIDEQKLEEQQTSTVVENKRVWLKPLQVFLGVVVSLIGGIVCMYLTTNVAAGFFFGLIVAFFMGIVGAVLLRSHWAILVVPIAFTLGEWLVTPPLFGFDFMDLNFSVFIFALAGPIFALFGSLISITIVRNVKKPVSTTMPKDF